MDARPDKDHPSMYTNPNSQHRSSAEADLDQEQLENLITLWEEEYKGTLSEEEKERVADIKKRLAKLKEDDDTEVDLDQEELEAYEMMAATGAKLKILLVQLKDAVHEACIEDKEDEYPSRADMESLAEAEMANLVQWPTPEPTPATSKEISGPTTFSAAAYATKDQVQHLEKLVQYEAMKVCAIAHAVQGVTDNDLYYMVLQSKDFGPQMYPIDFESGDHTSIGRVSVHINMAKWRPKYK